MKFGPVNKHIIGRVAISPIQSTLTLPDGSQSRNVTKFVFVDEVSPEAEAAGYKPGDLVLPDHIKNIFFNAGRTHRATLSIDVVICKPQGISLEGFLDAFGKPFDPEIREEAVQ